MSFSVSNLTTFTENNGDLLLNKLMTVQTIASDSAVVHPGIKSAVNISQLATTLYAQAGGNCSFTSSGSTVLSDLTIATDEVVYAETLCPKTLNAYGLQKKMKPGRAGNESLPVEELFVQERLELIQAEIEKQIWAGDKVNGNGNLAFSNGLLRAAEVASGSTVNITGSSFVAATALAAVNTYAASIPAGNRGLIDYELYLSPAAFAIYVQGAIAANLYHYSPDFDWSKGIVHVGADRITVKQSVGLVGKTTWLLMPVKTIQVGVDALADSETIEFFFDKAARNVKMYVSYRIGATIAFPANVVVVKP